MAAILSNLEIIGGTLKRNLIGIRKGRTGGTNSARYCYSVWFRHLTWMFQNGITNIPETVVEFGPGDSIGIGLCALLSGVKKYYALDAVIHVDGAKNQVLFNEIVELFKKRANIPDNREFPLVHPVIDDYHFPFKIISDDQILINLSDARINQIRKELINFNNIENKFIRYIAPWNTIEDIKQNSIDMIYSQAVLEHIDDPAAVYEVMYNWAKPGGVISHEIDFKCHGLATEWNGHWGYSDWVWKLIRGRSDYLINRYPHSFHIRNIKKCGYKILCDNYMMVESTIQKKQINKKMLQYFEDDDLFIPSAFIQAIKPTNQSN
nr:class I SAM-dependent methyltransferase [uncultured Methanoregula sp.]